MKQLCILHNTGNTLKQPNISYVSYARNGRSLQSSGCYWIECDNRPYVLRQVCGVGLVDLFLLCSPGYSQTYSNFHNSASQTAEITGMHPASSQTAGFFGGKVHFSIPCDFEASITEQPCCTSVGERATCWFPATQLLQP